MMRNARSAGPRLLRQLAQGWPLHHHHCGLGRAPFSATPPATPTTTFAALGIHPSLIERLPPGVRAPTPDQAVAARALLGDGGDGGDGGRGGGGGGGGVTALAGPTGSGKTLAYLLPLLTRWLNDHNDKAVLVVAPSQELAAQVARVGKGLLLQQRRPAGGDPATTPTTTAAGSVQLLIGGASIARQRAALAELGADRRTRVDGETEAERAARLRRQQAGRRLARERRRRGSADNAAAPLALVAGTPARLARLLTEGSLDGAKFGALVLEEADQLSAGSSGGGRGGEQGEDGDSDDSDDDDQHYFDPFSKKGYADALEAVCASLPQETKARAVLVSATLRRRPGALAALTPLLQRGQGEAPPVFVPSSPAPETPLKDAAPASPQPQTPPKHVLVLAPPQHRAAAARAALRALGARAALVFAAERGGRLDDAAAKLRGLVGGGQVNDDDNDEGGVWVLHGGMAPAARKAALGAFSRAVGGEKGRGRRPRTKRKKRTDDDDEDDGGAPVPLFADDDDEEQEDEEGAKGSSTNPKRSPPAVLVASDLAARGLDLPGLDAVVSLDPPRTPAAYAHRAGRVGRLNSGGGGGPSFVVTVATAGAQAAAVRRLCASLGVVLLEGSGPKG